MEQKIAKIGVSIEADQALDRILPKANDGFVGGHVNKNALASWIILNFESRSDSMIEKIRKDHFDKIAYLDSIVKELKKARKSGTELPDINTLLAPIASEIKSISAQNKLRSKKEETNEA